MTVMEDLLARDTQASFRVSSHRMTNGIDNAPEEDIQLFYDLLLAEAEQSVMNYETFGSTTTANNTTGKPTVKAMQGSLGNTKQRETSGDHLPLGAQKEGVVKGRGAILHMTGKQSRTKQGVVGYAPAQPTAEQNAQHFTRLISCRQQLGGVGQQAALGVERGNRKARRAKGGVKANQRARPNNRHHNTPHQTGQETHKENNEGKVSAAKLEKEPVKNEEASIREQ